MAKWGEGDPRWIVEERPDATNVNNWHWTEKNATPWSEEKIKSLFLNFKISECGAEIDIEEVTKVTGEASVNNRKGKLIFFYEWNIALKWCGYLNGQADKLVKGTIVIPNLSEDYDLEDIEITVSIDVSDNIGEKVKAIMYNVGRDKLRKLLETYTKELKEEFSKGMILPKKDGEPTTKTDGMNNITTKFNSKISMGTVNNTPKTTTNESVKCKIDVTTINSTEKFQCRANEIYDALTRSEMMTAFTRAYVKMDAKVGGEFSLFGGNITGKIQELIPNKKIVQLWRYKQWQEGHFSNVVIEIEQKEDHTELRLIQTGVPKSEADTTKINWERYYFNSIRQAFGFGSFLV